MLKRSGLTYSKIKEITGIPASTLCMVLSGRLRGYLLRQL